MSVPEKVTPLAEHSHTHQANLYTLGQALFFFRSFFLFFVLLLSIIPHLTLNHFCITASPSCLLGTQVGLMIN